MKDVISVDELLKMELGYANDEECPICGHDHEDHEPIGARKKFKKNLHSLLISKLPKPILECPPDCNDREHAGMEGYNSAIAEIDKIIKNKPYYMCRRDGCSVFSSIGGRMTVTAIDAEMDKANDEYLKAQLNQLLIKERQDVERIMFEWTLSRLIDLKKGISTIAEIEEMCYAGLRNSGNLENQLGEKS